MNTKFLLLAFCVILYLDFTTAAGAGLASKSTLNKFKAENRNHEHGFGGGAKHPKVNEPQPQHLFELGSVKHMTYFLDNSTARTWDEAKTFAAEMEMELAEFWAAAEADFFKNISTSLLPLDGYWTGGRDSKLQSQFKWDSANRNFSSFTLDFMPQSIFRSCILLGHFGMQRVMRDDDCQAKWFTLLQSE